MGPVAQRAGVGAVNETLRARRAHPVLILVLAVIVSLGLAFKPVMRHLFPLKFMHHITQAAEQHGFEPLFIASIVKVESGFNERALSSKGARGLMQIMPETGAWVAQQMDWVEFDVEMLYNVEPNLSMGTWYLRELHRLFHDNEVAALAAYNAGQNRVRQWLDEGRWDGREETLDDVPFGETRIYVRRVLATQEIFNWLYGGR